MHRKGKRRHDQHGPCRLSRYLSCSCFRLRLGCDTIFCFCRASWRAAYSSAESLVKRVCACLAYFNAKSEKNYVNALFFAQNYLFQNSTHLLQKQNTSATR